jgi:hypothetical protein
VGGVLDGAGQNVEVEVRDTEAGDGGGDRAGNGAIDEVGALRP